MSTQQKPAILLYFTLVDKRVKGKMVEYKLRHHNDSPTNHETHLWSADKDEVQNCYRDLEIGHTYVVVEWRTGRVIQHRDGSSHNQIVYAGCVEIDPVDISTIIKFSKTHTDKETFDYATHFYDEKIIAFDEEFQ